MEENKKVETVESVETTPKKRTTKKRTVKKVNRGFEKVKEEHMKHKDEETNLPVRATKNSAGYDLYSKEEYMLSSGQTKVFWTDVKAFMKPNEVLMLFVRSSIGIKRGIRLANGTGIIDSDYYNNIDNDGNIGIALHNFSRKPVLIRKGEKIAQCLFVEFLTADNEETVETERTGGIGSTDE